MLIVEKDKVISRRSSSKEIIYFSNLFLETLRDELCNHGYLELKESNLPAVKISFKGQGRSRDLGSYYQSGLIHLNLYCASKYGEYNVVSEYRRYAHHPIIGQIINADFQEYVIAELAHEYAHCACDHLYDNVKPHGKEFQHLYKILRNFSNASLSDKCLVGYSTEDKKICRKQGKYHRPNLEFLIREL